MAATRGHTTSSQASSWDTVHIMIPDDMRVQEGSLARNGVPSMTGRMLIESLGVYLPARIVSTDEILQGCKVKLRFPLERVTGIEYRHVAGENEFSVELAHQAILDCLGRSTYAPEDIDLIVSCDTSHSTGFLR